MFQSLQSRSSVYARFSHHVNHQGTKGLCNAPEVYRIDQVLNQIPKDLVKDPGGIFLRSGPLSERGQGLVRHHVRLWLQRLWPIKYDPFRSWLRLTRSSVHYREQGALLKKHTIFMEELKCH